jgi:transposase-like protein
VWVWQDGGVKRRSAQFRTTRRHLTSKEKAEILKAHRRSGLSLLAFAEQHGLCYSSLLRWRCRHGNGVNLPVPPDTEVDPRFVPVKIEGEALGGEYVLSWAGGCSLKIPRQFETDSLHRLLSVLEAVR